MQRYQHSPGKGRIQETPIFWQVPVGIPGLLLQVCPPIVCGYKIEMASMCYLLALESFNGFTVRTGRRAVSTRGPRWRALCL